MGASLGQHMPLRSYHPRRRGLPPARQAAFERRLEVWGLGPEGPPLSALGGVFDGDVVLDIGFGGGEGLVAMAVAEPDRLIIGADVHTPGVAFVLDAVESAGLNNVRVIHGDVLDVLERIPDAWLAGIRIWFPDPWPKPKQRKRRLIRPEVIAPLVDRLRPGGFVHVATDHADYAVAAQAVLDGDARLRGGVIPRPTWRPLTRFEQRGLNEGRTAVDLWYDR